MTDKGVFCAHSQKVIDFLVNLIVDIRNHGENYVPYCENYNDSSLMNAVFERLTILNENEREKFDDEFLVFSCTELDKYVIPQYIKSSKIQLIINQFQISKQNYQFKEFLKYLPYTDFEATAHVDIDDTKRDDTKRLQVLYIPHNKSKKLIDKNYEYVIVNQQEYLVLRKDDCDNFAWR